MSDSSQPWSNDHNAPQIPYLLYFAEKTCLAGNFLGAMCYGIAIVLFFRCMSSLLNPTNRVRGGIKWGLLAHTAAMFSFLTLGVAMRLDIPSISYIENRAFPGTDTFPPGPYGYEWLLDDKAVDVVPSVVFLMNTYLADGFLLYRYYMIYSMNYWVIILPCVMYLASLALSILITYCQITKSENIAWVSTVIHFEVSYYSISLSLNVLLTLMIAIRLIRHSKNIRHALGPGTDGGLYNVLVTIVVESCVLYAIISLVFMGAIGSQNQVQAVFGPSFITIQVIAPFLIVLRVANRTALTSDVTASRKIDGSIRFKSEGVSTGNQTFHDGNPASSVETNGETAGEACAGHNIEEIPL